MLSYSTGNNCTNSFPFLPKILVSFGSAVSKNCLLLLTILWRATPRAASGSLIEQEVESAPHLPADTEGKYYESKVIEERELVCEPSSSSLTGALLVEYRTRILVHSRKKDHHGVAAFSIML